MTLLVLMPWGLSAEDGVSIAVGTYRYSIPSNSVIGMERSYVVREGESLYEVARWFGLGMGELLRANPGVDPWVPPEGARLRLPTQWVLPNAEDEGIVVNLSEQRLFYFFNVWGMRKVVSFPVGIGRDGHETPTGIYTITRKIKNPVWNPPPSAIEKDPTLPTAVPPGPDNPLGEYWLGLSSPRYGIHGTNRPWSLGMEVTLGCIRLHPDDIRWLFDRVDVGTNVQILRQPVKAGRRNQQWYLEIETKEGEDTTLLEQALSAIGGRNASQAGLDFDSIGRAVRARDGLPVEVSD